MSMSLSAAETQIANLEKRADLFLEKAKEFKQTSRSNWKHFSAQDRVRIEDLVEDMKILRRAFAHLAGAGKIRVMGTVPGPISDLSLQSVLRPVPMKEARPGSPQAAGENDKGYL